MKIHPVGAKSFHANGETNMIKLIVDFCNFANARKMAIQLLLKNESW